MDTTTTVTAAQLGWVEALGFKVSVNTRGHFEAGCYLAPEGKKVDRNGFIVGTGSMADRLIVTFDGTDWATAVLRPSRYAFVSGNVRCYQDSNARKVWAYVKETLRQWAQFAHCNPTHPA